MRSLCVQCPTVSADAGVLNTGAKGGTTGVRGVAGCAEAALCRLGSRLSSGAPAPRATRKRKGQFIQTGFSFVTVGLLGLSIICLEYTMDIPQTLFWQQTDQQQCSICKRSGWMSLYLQDNRFVGMHDAWATATGQLMFGAACMLYAVSSCLSIT